MPIYLDNNATTQLDPRVLEVMSPYLSGPYGNPSSVHRYGRLARQAIETARQQVAALVNAQPNEVIFTGGGTEANNMAIKGVLQRNPGRVLIGATEHHAVLEPAEASGRCAVLPVDAKGHINRDVLDDPNDCALVSIMWVNNETGVIQDVPAIAEALENTACLMHTDAVQAAGKISVDFAGSGVDLMSLAAHKIYGPKGVGALIIKSGIDLMPLLHGGGQEDGLRGGTENIAGIAGFGAAAALAAQELAQRNDHCRQLRDAFETRLAGTDGVTLVAADSERVANTSMLCLLGWDGETLVMEFDRRGIAVSSGSACQSGTGEPSHVLLAMGIPRDIAQGSVRISFGVNNSMEDVEVCVAAVKELLG